MKRFSPDLTLSRGRWCAFAALVVSAMMFSSPAKAANPEVALVDDFEHGIPNAMDGQQGRFQSGASRIDVLRDRSIFHGGPNGTSCASASTGRKSATVESGFSSSMPRPPRRISSTRGRMPFSPSGFGDKLAVNAFKSSWRIARGLREKTRWKSARFGPFCPMASLANGKRCSFHSRTRQRWICRTWAD